MTKSTSSNFSFSSNSSSVSSSSFEFNSSFIVFFRSSVLWITFSEIASGYVIIILFFLLFNLFRTSDLSKTFELSVSLNWYDLLNDAGKNKTSFFKIFSRSFVKYKASSLSLFIKRWFLLELSRIEAEYKANDEPIFPLKKN